MKKIAALLLMWFTGAGVFSQSLTPLSVEKIMRDPKWIGASPSNPEWSADGQTLYFNWNPENAPSDSLYAVSLKNMVPQKVPAGQISDIVFSNAVAYNSARSFYAFARGSDIYFGNFKTGVVKQITNTATSESAPRFSFNESKIVFLLDDNLYAWDITSGETVQLTDFRKGLDPAVKEAGKKPNSQEEWLKTDELKLMEVLRERKEKREADDAFKKKWLPTTVRRTIYTGDSSVHDIQISADGRFVSYLLTKAAKDARHTIIPNYVTEDGFTEDIAGRSNVGAPLGSQKLCIYDREKDTVLGVAFNNIPGIRDIPRYVHDYPELLKKKVKENAVREIRITKVSWAPHADYAVVDIDAIDNKDRWLMKLDGATGALSLLDRQHDDAWIGGPGISGYNTGWINNSLFWFQSEETGFSHLYTVDVMSRKKLALTFGKYEVLQCELSPDKRNFFITTNEVHPGEQQLYRLPVTGGKAVRLTEMTGANQTTLSPDGVALSIMYSYTNQPWELYIQESRPGKKAVQITDRAKSETFSSYSWRDPELVNVPASDGKFIPARLYRPAKPHPARPAVIFVHGAGYLQNAHKWWSSYFREYLFHNLLADNGYFVLDMDYRASAGYGRDWRTAIYRHMGGRDLDDHLDGAKYLTENCGVDPKRIGIYGGSYGGFITLMALFTSPGTFAAGAALRPVTDWAHYNHGYTSNILNTPVEDSVAYRRSSPIYFANGLRDPLLICHGVIDVNVHFQDVVRLNQRLIELGKDNWQVAMYPVEDHGFKEPSSWTDEYKRIFTLFESVLKK